jgi:hypothetical protein
MHASTSVFYFIPCFFLFISFIYFFLALFSFTIQVMNNSIMCVYVIQYKKKKNCLMFSNNNNCNNFEPKI